MLAAGFLAAFAERAGATEDAAGASGAGTSGSYSATAGEDLRPRIIAAEDRVLLLRAEALYRFEPSTEAWTVTTEVHGLPEGPLQRLVVAGDDAWVGGNGVAFSGVRFDDWRRYPPGQGYPGRAVRAVASDADYAYAGTDAGAARFDRYILEWEPLVSEGADSLGPVSDIAMGDDRVWFALERGVAEYRKDTESVRVDTLLGGLVRPRVLALRRSERRLWAVTDKGIAGYDLALRTWVAFRPGVDFADARVRGLRLQGEDLWLGTDDGLWRYEAGSGIWRRDDSSVDMPGHSVRGFEIEPERIWVATERAFAVYERASARWVDFTASVPVAPAQVREISRTGAVLILLGENAIGYGLSQGQTSPSLFTWRSRPVLATEVSSATEPPGEGARVVLDDAGLRTSRGEEASLTWKGGTTLFVEATDPSTDDSSVSERVEFRTDLALNGRFGEERTLNGFYDSTDPENVAYQVTWRGARDDLLRAASVGEITADPYNTVLTPGAGLRGGQVRLEAGPRLGESRRRLLTTEAWAGRRRTVPGRDLFVGGNRSVSGSLRDIDYARRAVFRLPRGWSESDLRSLAVYRDDGDRTTDDVNTERVCLGGRDGAWDRLRLEVDYALGARRRELYLTAPLQDGESLVAVLRRSALSAQDREVDLTERWLRSHYYLGTDPVTGSLRASLIDTTGATVDSDGVNYLRRFGLDLDGDGGIDADRYDPISGFLFFPDSLPFPPFVYGSPPRSGHTLRFAYDTRRAAFTLSHPRVVPNSEKITLDRQPLQAGVDYTIIPASGLFSFFEQVSLDDDSVIEVRYLYEVETEDETVLGGQLGFAPIEPVFLGAGAARWDDPEIGRASWADLNARLEWSRNDRLLRIMPEWAVSTSDSLGEAAAGGGSLQGRYRGLEVAAVHRVLAKDFASMEDRRTRFGRLREETEATCRVDLGPQVDGELIWNRAESSPSRSGTEGAPGGGAESSLQGRVRVLRSGLPNLELRRGRVRSDSAGAREDRWVSRLDLEVNPEQASRRLFGTQRLWLRGFVQRSEREGTRAAADTLGSRRRITDHALARLNGSMGDPLAFNVAIEERRTHRPAPGDWKDLNREQRLDLTAQARVHPSLDVYGRHESERSAGYLRRRASGGYGVQRLSLVTILAYPGQVLSTLAPLSWRLDWLVRGRDDGAPGDPRPGMGCHFSRADGASRHTWNRDGIIEGRLQLLPRLRFIERWREGRSRIERPGSVSETRERQWESRWEIEPRGGLILLRGIHSLRVVPDWSRESGPRFVGQWDQTWGGGFLTYLSLDATRESRREGHLNARREFWNPQARITWRRPHWRKDASLGGGWTWDRTRGPGVGGGWRESRQQSYDLSISLQPHRILSTKLQYAMVRSGGDAGPGLAAARRTEQELRLRVQLRV